MDIDATDAREQRRFGLLMAGAFTTIGLVRWAWHAYRLDAPTGPPYLFLGLALAFLGPVLVRPSLLGPVLVGWMKLALGLNWLMTRVLLTLAYVLLFVPTALAMRALRHDPLNRRRDPETESYWEEPEAQPEEPEAYLNQF